MYKLPKSLILIALLVVLGGQLLNVTALASPNQTQQSGGDGLIVFSGDDGTGQTLWTMDANGENTTKLFDIDAGYRANFPEFSPDGSEIAYIKSPVGCSSNQNCHEIWIVKSDGSDVDGGRNISIPGSTYLNTGTGLSWHPSGDKVYAGLLQNVFRTSGYVYSAGPENQILVPVLPSDNTRLHHFRYDPSDPTGQTIVGKFSGPTHISTMQIDADGKNIDPLTAQHLFTSNDNTSIGHFNPNTNEISFMNNQNGHFTISSIRSDFNNPDFRVVYDSGNVFVNNPTWSDDGQYIAFARYGDPAILRVNADGSGGLLDLTETADDVGRNWIILETPDWASSPNEPPEADARGPYLAAVTTTIPLDGFTFDPDGDSLTIYWDAEAGTLSDPTIEDPDYTAGSLSGIFNLSITVTDDHGLSDSSTTFVVVYDPEGGFVTGGGWIWSESGWCQLDVICAGAEGKANFGFVSKYKNGASVPTGNTEFNFSSGELNFHSDTYEWLVVTQNGSNAQFKGSGTINGGLDPNGEEFKFMIWAQDLDPEGEDTFRIKIWFEDAQGNETIVYDNGVDQAISGGNIKIHQN